MKKRIDLDSWYRREHFEFFSTFDEPFFGLTADIACRRAYERSKTEDISFFALYLHAVLSALNRIPELCTRIEKDGVFQYDPVHVSSTLPRRDHSFAFSFIPFDQDIHIFIQNIEKELSAVQNSSGLRNNGDNARSDVIHFSALPWLTFTSLQHPRQKPGGDGIPKISVGKMFTRDNELFIPVSLHAHHGLADGYHAAKFYEELTEELSKY